MVVGAAIAIIYHTRMFSNFKHKSVLINKQKMYLTKTKKNDLHLGKTKKIKYSKTD